MTKDTKIEIISAIVIFGFFLSVVISYINGYYLKMAYPYNTFLFIPEVKFTDFISEVNLASNLNPYTNDNGVVKAVYYPFSYLLLYVFSLFGKYSLLLSIGVFTVLFVFTANSYFKPKHFSSYKNILLLIFLSYPFLFDLDRANIEWMVFLFTSWSLYFYYENKHNLAIVFLSMAVSMKFYPIIFLTLFLLDKKYTVMVKTILLTSLITLISMYSFSGELNETYKNILLGQQFFKDNYVLADFGGLAYNNSLFGILKFVNLAMKKVIGIKLLSLVYFITVISIYSSLVYFMWRKNLKRWEKITIITFSMLLFPFVSFDYKLLFVFIPIFYFIREEDTHHTMGMIPIVLFALLLIPKNFYFIYANISISILLNPLIMVSLILIVLSNNSNNKKVTN
ncbi:MAG: glycosyltransferase 87 family protein [Sulfuricurvum sp.]|uniref:glycosyltransferase 87 family protein n=1 Tax=Sulfuricurvum sp. TaxID=2025608 RepID=UPI00262C54ED|nr:glycosyltransferase 87 family protein [Sulfuricurvum sp.]MDD2828637.1 glycosyltransferase 87 family protein [Sulfuricurvum sp.]MDD4948314.1 glycosyltransferase 87 family protein [Sulfuricurvum sp.]